MTTLTDHSDPRFLHSEVTDRIIAGFYETYDEMGYGFLESNYASALAIALQSLGLAVAREVPVQVRLRGNPVGFYRVDLIVEGLAIVELKASVSIGIADERQLQN